MHANNLEFISGDAEKGADFVDKGGTHVIAEEVSDRHLKAHCDEDAVHDLNMWLACWVAIHYVMDCAVEVKEGVGTTNVGNSAQIFVVFNDVWFYDNIVHSYLQTQR